MSSSHAFRSRERSLSVKQLIDARIKKLEEEQISEIRSEYDQKHASLTNSVQVKTLRLNSEFGSTEQLELISEGLQSEIKSKLRTLLEVLYHLARSNNTLAIDKYSMAESLRAAIDSADAMHHLVDIDSYLEEILKFDESIKDEFVECMTAGTPPTVEELVFNCIKESLNMIVIDGMCESMRRSNVFEPASTEIAETSKEGMRHQKHYLFRQLPHFSKVNNDAADGLESAKLLLRKLQSQAEIEYNIHRQIDDELSTVDGKYLKLIAEAASCVYAEETKLDHGSAGSIIDPLWVKKVIPTILKHNESLAKDFINAVSKYVSVNYVSNRRLQKLVQIESVKTTFN